MMIAPSIALMTALSCAAALLALAPLAVEVRVKGGRSKLASVDRVQEPLT